MRRICPVRRASAASSEQVLKLNRGPLTSSRSQSRGKSSTSRAKSYSSQAHHAPPCRYWMPDPPPAPPPLPAPHVPVELGAIATSTAAGRRSGHGQPLPPPVGQPAKH